METPQATTPPPQDTRNDFEKMFDSVLEDLKKTEDNINKLREFMAKWKHALLLCNHWGANPSYRPSISIRKGYSATDNFDPKGIARAFGADGWKRHKNNYTCGQIDWKKTVDDVEIEITGAEIVDLKPREDVRL